MKIKQSCISTISFTDKGDELNKKIVAALESEFKVFISMHSERHCTLGEWTKEAFKISEYIIFIGACGIAVRAAAPFIVSKTTDPAVVVIDENAGFVISLLSGHIGGGNEFAKKLAEITGAVPVITTATDINEVFAVDSWAVKMGYEIQNPENIKYISGALLRGEKVGLLSDIKDVFGVNLPENIRITEGAQEIGKYECGIMVSPYLKSPFKYTLNLIPKCLFVGCGSRRMADSEALVRLLDEVFTDEVSLKAVAGVASIDIKSEEKSIKRLSEYLNVSCSFFSADELNQAEGDFTASDFVRSTTGTDNVCERSAVAAAGNNKAELLIKKTKGEGVTLAVAINRNI